MKKIRFTEAQIIGILTEQSQQDQKVSEVCRKHGISEATFYNWRSKYAGMKVDELKRLKELEYENARLKKIVANQSLEIDAIKDLLTKKVLTPDQKEHGLEYLAAHHQMSHAQACKLVGYSRTKKYYHKRMPAKDAVVKKAIEEVIGNSRKGRMKVIKLVQKKHPELGDSKIRRVYENEGFSLSKRLRRRIKDNPANPISIPLTANQEWAMDFMSDALDNGRRIRTLNIVDHFNRQCKGLEVDFNLPARRVIEIVGRAIERYGKPLKIRTDNGPEFRSKRFQLWMKHNHIEWSRIQKGKPQQNAIIERFNKTYREDVLDANLFYSIEQANEVTERWVDDYNHERPHQSLNYQTPMAYAA